MSKAIRVRFRNTGRSAVLALPIHLREKGALALGKRFQWEALEKALGLSIFRGLRSFIVTAIGTEGNPLGEGELVIHVA